MRAHCSSSCSRRGFTVIELLVVIGIIVLLAGIAIPMAMRSYRNAEVSRVRLDLHTIATALDAYKQDHGDYPRLPYPNGAPGAAQQHVGANLLMWTMASPAARANDGADGPGFRTRTGGQGKVYGPYVKIESFTIAKPDGSTAAADFLDAVLLDKSKQAILYFPARGTKPDITQPNSFVTAATDSTTPKPLYNQYDNAALGLEAMRIRLGDEKTINGRIDTDPDPAKNESAKYTGPFLLWCAGIDGLYGTKDDITNFNE